MPKSLTAKLTDLKIIQQLEQTIGRKLEKLDEIDDESIGYVQNEQNQITGLSLYSCDLTKLPLEICRLHNLTELHLKYNKLSILPAEIGRLHNLTNLNLFNNQISTLPAEIGQLHNLTNLNLGFNKLSTLPAEIGQLHNLTELGLSYNQLSTLPAEIGQWHNLTWLILSNNKLSTLPAEIGQLHNLTKLILGHNQLRSLPAEIGQLRKLKILDLDINGLTQFPRVLLELNLEVKWDIFYYQDGINVFINPFEIPPVEIVKQGRQAIVDYYVALDQQTKRPLHEAKLILIGDGAAGKTSLMKRLLEQPFDPQESQTHGININTLLLPDSHDNEIKLHCWDFGGQQIMHATHQFFLSKRCLYLLVIDSRRETQVEYWLKHIQAFGDNSPVIIVINKIDENPHFSLSPRQLTPLYPNLKHIHRISCRTNQGLTELKTTIQHTLPAIDLIHTMLPANLV